MSSISFSQSTPPSSPKLQPKTGIVKSRSSDLLTASPLPPSIYPKEAHDVIASGKVKATAQQYLSAIEAGSQSAASPGKRPLNASKPKTGSASKSKEELAAASLDRPSPALDPSYPAQSSVSGRISSAEQPSSLDRASGGSDENASDGSSSAAKSTIEVTLSSEDNPSPGASEETALKGSRSPQQGSSQAEGPELSDGAKQKAAAAFSSSLPPIEEETPSSLLSEQSSHSSRSPNRERSPFASRRAIGDGVLSTHFIDSRNFVVSEASFGFSSPLPPIKPILQPLQVGREFDLRRWRIDPTGQVYIMKVIQTLSDLFRGLCFVNRYTSWIVRLSTEFNPASKAIGAACVLFSGQEIWQLYKQNERVGKTGQSDKNYSIEGSCDHYRLVDAGERVEKGPEQLKGWPTRVRQELDRVKGSSEQTYDRIEVERYSKSELLPLDPAGRDDLQWRTRSAVAQYVGDLSYATSRLITLDALNQLSPVVLTTYVVALRNISALCSSLSLLMSGLRLRNLWNLSTLKQREVRVIDQEDLKQIEANINWEKWNFAKTALRVALLALTSYFSLTVQAAITLTTLGIDLYLAQRRLEVRPVAVGSCVYEAV